MHALWVLVSTFLFSLMGVCIKLASDRFSVGDMLFWRGFIGVAALYVICSVGGASLRTSQIGLHARRSTVGLISMTLWFYTITVLPLPTAMTLAYTTPLWVAAFVLANSFRPGVRPTNRLLTLIPMAGFAGVILLLRPTFDDALWFAGLLGVLGAISSAIAYHQIRLVSLAGEPEWRIVFYFSLTTALAGLLWMLASGTGLPRNLVDWALMLAIGLTALGGQFALTRAFARGHALVAVTLQYSGVVFAAIWGMLIWGEVPAPGTWLGMACIVASGIGATWLGIAAPRQRK